MASGASLPALENHNKRGRMRVNVIRHKLLFRVYLIKHLLGQMHRGIGRRQTAVQR